MRTYRSAIALGAVLIALCAPLPAAAQKDAPKSRDHPLLTRFPNSFITEYRAAPFDAVDFPVGPPPPGAAPNQPKRQRIEGATTRIHYFYTDKSKEAAPLQVIRNYQNALKAVGGEVVYERLPIDNDAGETTLRVAAGGKEVWVRVEPVIFSGPTQSYILQFVEVQAMQQVVSANRMLDEINKNGFIALYVNFDSGRADLKADGQATAREIAAMLKAAPTLQIGVEGHTDNVGSPAANKALSEARAKSVAAAVVAAGVPANRLVAAGYGAEKPIADNRGEEGRAKNRRVELVRR